MAQRNQRKLALTILPGRFVICRLPAAARIPDWASRGQIFSITRTADELSITCEESLLPPPAAWQPDFKFTKDWRALKFEGPFDFSEIGVLASVVAPLAEAGVSISVVSTFDTDYLFVQESGFDRAKETLVAHGHTIRLLR